MTAKPGAIFAVSDRRYSGGAAVKRKYGSSTITKFLIGIEGSDASSWKAIEGYGRTPGERKTYALNEYKRLYGQAVPALPPGTTSASPKWDVGPDGWPVAMKV